MLQMTTAHETRSDALNRLIDCTKN